MYTRMKQTSFTIILSIVTFIADTAIFNSLAEIRHGLSLLCIALIIFSVICLLVRKIYYKKIESTSKVVYLFIVSVVTLASIGVSILISPSKKDYSSMISLSDPKFELDTTIIRYANLGFSKAQLAASAAYMKDGEQSPMYNPTKSLEYALLGSINGDTASLLNAAKMFFEGRGTEVNYERAYFLLSIAEKNGSKLAPILMKRMIDDELINIKLLKNIENYLAFGDSTIFHTSDIDVH